MKLKARWEVDVFGRFTVVQVAVTVAGILFLVLFMTSTAPVLRANLGVLFGPVVIVGLIGGGLTQVVLFPWMKALFQLSRSVVSEAELSEETWERLKEATYQVPLRLLITTLTNWPVLSVTLGLWGWWRGTLNSTDAIRVAMSGVVYAPVQGLILFFLARRTLLRLGSALMESGHAITPGRLGGLSIRGKLIASFVSLAVVPLVAGIFINEVQRERSFVNQNLAEVCRALALIQAAGDQELSPESFRRGIEDSRSRLVLPQDTEFQVVRISAEGRTRLLTESLHYDLAARSVWRKEIRKGPEEGCISRLLPGQRRYLVMRFFESQRLWISALTDPFPGKLPFFSRYGSTLIMVILVIGLGGLLGFLAAEDVGLFLRELTTAARRSANGDFVQVAGFLPDDEMSELATGYNALVNSIRRELWRSGEMISRAREVITGLARQTSDLQTLADRQREVINEQSSLAVEASGGAEEVSRAAEEIRERAVHTREQMEEAAHSCRQAESMLHVVGEVMAGIAAAAEKIAAEMVLLEDNYHRMEDVVKIIEEVAEKTEMLSLNAAIEAGSGGGKESRFSVVAGELQRLSERIYEGTKDIKRLFYEVRQNSLAMAHAIEIGRARAGQGPQWIKKLGESISLIEGKATKAGDSMGEIVKMTAEQSQALSQMKQMVSELSAVAGVIDEVSQQAETTARQLVRLAEQLQHAAGESPSLRTSTEQEGGA